MLRPPPLTPPLRSRPSPPQRLEVAIRLKIEREAGRRAGSALPAKLGGAPAAAAPAKGKGKAKAKKGRG